MQGCMKMERIVFFNFVGVVLATKFLLCSLVDVVARSAGRQDRKTRGS